MTLSKLGVKGFSIFVFLTSFATGAEARKIHMAVATFSQSVLPMVVAQEKGYFREEDLEVELILMTAPVRPRSRRDS
jgi:ABC-type nitrate/sulfonate/bicarbonate transport system substrate-binding protein